MIHFQAAMVRDAAHAIAVGDDTASRARRKAMVAYHLAIMAHAWADLDSHMAARYLGTAAAELWCARELVQLCEATRATWRAIEMAVVA